MSICIIEGLQNIAHYVIDMDERRNSIELSALDGVNVHKRMNRLERITRHSIYSTAN